MRYSAQLRLELGLLLRDLRGHVRPGRVQLGGQGVVRDRQDLGGVEDAYQEVMRRLMGK